MDVLEEMWGAVGSISFLLTENGKMVEAPG